MSNSNDASNRTLTIKRTFDAPIKLVWEAWIQPEHISNWWGPKGMKTNVLQYDFVVGGKWKYSMELPDGKEFLSDGIFKVIEELEKVYSSANFYPMTLNVEIQALFEEAGDKTNFTFNVVHETEEYCKQQEAMGFLKGWGSVFNELENYIAGLQA